MNRFKTEKYGRANYHHSNTAVPDPAAFERHCHSGYELIYVVRGSGKYIVESAEYPLLPNTVLLLRPYEYHYVCPGSDCAYERYVIHFSEEMFIDATKQISFVLPASFAKSGIYFPADTVSSEIRTQFELLDLSFFGSDITDPETPSRPETVFRIITNQILLLLSYLNPDAPQKAENELVGKIMQYLSEHLAEDVSLEEMSRHFFVSKYYLCHTFRSHMGVSIFSYLTTKRIALAQQMLEDGTPAVDAAYQVGFGDYSVFYRAYRKITGESPAKTKGRAKRGSRSSL